MTEVLNSEPNPEMIVKFTVRMPRKLAVQLTEAAQTVNRSLNNMVVTACMEHVAHFFPNNN